ncbi:uridine kinase family protein [Pseudonocardia adelaidensis]|uniref:4-amino-4-deoxychorismate synthase n=1 Tax=Pseudonocardia adelaidensis TaxID=648754 RepID=A0ABP9NKW4_9PSEU
MRLTLRDEEPPAGPWRIEPLASLTALLLEPPRTTKARPPIAAVDGRGASGKTTLAGRIRAALPGTQVVHTDDIAWEHSRFGWDDLMIAGVLEPLHDGHDVHYQPPAWAPHGRTGHIDASARAPLVIVEGVGASRRELSHLIDTAVWVQSDWPTAERRGLVRDGGDARALEGWRQWEAEELPFLAADRPWERASIIVAGTPQIGHDPEREVVVAPPLSGRSI